MVEYMSIYKKLGKMAGDMSIAEKYYAILQTETYKTEVYRTWDLGEGMAVLHKNMQGWYKPWFVIDHNKKTAFEFIDDWENLLTITEDDIDWKSLKKLPENAIMMAQYLSFHFPSFIREFRNGVAQVDWQLNPDGRYYMDDDGFGMTPDVEINIHGFIDRNGHVLVKFRYVSDNKELEVMRKEAEQIEKQLNNG